MCSLIDLNICTYFAIFILFSDLICNFLLIFYIIFFTDRYIIIYFYEQDFQLTHSYRVTSLPAITDTLIAFVRMQPLYTLFCVRLAKKK